MVRALGPLKLICRAVAEISGNMEEGRANGETTASLDRSQLEEAGAAALCGGCARALVFQDDGRRACSRARGHSEGTLGATAVGRIGR